MFVKAVAIPKRLWVMKLRTDKGGEYTSQEMSALLFYQQGLHKSLPRLTIRSKMVFLKGTAEYWSVWFGAS